MKFPARTRRCRLRIIRRASALRTERGACVPEVMKAELVLLGRQRCLYCRPEYALVKQTVSDRVPGGSGENEGIGAGAAGEDVGQVFGEHLTQKAGKGDDALRMGL